MSENAGSHGLAQNDVHPDEADRRPADKDEEAKDGTDDSGNGIVNDAGDDHVNGEGEEDQSAPNLAAVLEGEMDEEGFDPATLANLAALSRLARDEGDEEEDIEHDFSSLVPEGQGQSQTGSQNQQILTTEQVRDIVSRLGEERAKETEDAENDNGDDEILREKEETRSEDAKRTDDDEQDEEDDDANYPGESASARSKRKRNRTSL